MELPNKVLLSLSTETPLVEAICELFNAFPGRRKFEGNVEKIYSWVKSNYSGNKNSLPGSSSAFSRKLDEEHDALSAAGIRVNIDDTGVDGTKIEIIRKKK